MTKKIFFLLILFLTEVLSVTHAQDVSFYSKYAEKGDPEAMYNLALCYMNGSGVQQDYTMAAGWLLKSAKKGYAPAQTELAISYVTGESGLPKDYSKAMSWLLKALGQNDARAYWVASVMYRDGLGLQKDVQKGFDFLKRSAELGYPLGQADYGILYISGLSELNIQPDNNRAYNWVSKAAQQNNDKAVYYMGLFYKYGYGVAADSEKAFKYFLQSAQSGYADAQAEVAYAYMSGEGVSVDYSEAHKYLNASLEQECAWAYKLTGDVYYYALGVEEDNEAAYKWYKKAMDAGYDEAIVCLAEMYINGWGVLKDEKKGFQLYHQAADKDVTSAYRGLGLCFENGYGTPINMKNAILNYKKAADNGNNFSCYRLYQIYREGAKDVSKDTQIAIQYLRQAADNDYPDALYSLGYEYYVGEIMHKEYSSALTYMKKAADQGLEYASGILGVCYYTGDPMVNKDFNLAFKYLSAALEDTSDLPKELLATIYRDLGACYRFGRGTTPNQSLASYYTEKAAEYGDQGSSDVVNILRR